MSHITTNRDMQRTTFVESLHNSFKKQTSVVLHERKKFITLAKSYIEDGLDDSECIELMMIDGLDRESSESYLSMARVNSEDNLNDEYSFQFEDNSGEMLCSYDIGRTIIASSDDEAWEMTEDLLASCNLHGAKVISVQKIK